MHFQTSMEANENIPSDYRCLVCGDRLGKVKKMFCALHTTAAGRRETAQQNEVIKHENLAKGFIYG